MRQFLSSIVEGINMSQETTVRKDGTFSFAVVIFSLFIMLPVAVFGAYGFYIKNEQELKLKCLEQGKTYVNSMCLQITAPK